MRALAKTAVALSFIGATAIGTTATTTTLTGTTHATTAAAVDGHVRGVGLFRAASVSPISMVRGTSMEGRIRTGDIDNICGGRLAASSFSELSVLPPQVFLWHRA
jgi:hypothetical protein